MIGGSIGRVVVRRVGEGIRREIKRRMEDSDEDRNDVSMTE